MRITESQLRQIIREELSEMRKPEGDPSDPSYRSAMRRYYKSQSRETSPSVPVQVTADSPAWTTISSRIRSHACGSTPIAAQMMTSTRMKTSERVQPVSSVVYCSHKEAE